MKRGFLTGFATASLVGFIRRKSVQMTAVFQKLSVDHTQETFCHNNYENPNRPVHKIPSFLRTIIKSNGIKSRVKLGCLLFLWSTPIFGAGTFAYTKATNKIVVTDGTAGAPATFNDMYTADQAGTVTLLAAWAPNNNTKALTYQLTPAMAKGLKIEFTVASKTAEADYIFITGTDIDGGAQTEALDVTAGNGTYTTTKWFATITNIDCSDNAAGGGTVWADGTVAVVQNQWGVVWEIVADRQYKIDCVVDWGDAVTATYFQSKNEQIYFNAVQPAITANATVKIGELTGSWGHDGSRWTFAGTTGDWNLLTGGTVLVYASQLHITNDPLVAFNTGSATLLNSHLLSENTTYPTGFWFNSTMTAVTLSDVFVANCKTLYIYKATSVSDLHVHKAADGIRLNSASATITDARFTSIIDNDALVLASGTPTLTLKNPKAAIGVVELSDAANAVIEQYTCNIHVADENGNDLQSVVADCEYANLIQGSDGKTYKCIQNHTAVDATHKPITGTDWATYWELYSATGGYGDWNTGFAYKSGTAEWTAGTISTDANGDIAEQNIQYKKWVGTSEIEEARIHKFTLTYGGDTHVIQDYIVDHPVVWHLEFPPMATMLSAIYNKLPTNYIMGSSVVTDKDDEIDAILADTNLYDTDAEHAAAIWNAAIASYGTAGTYGEELEDLDPNVTILKNYAVEWDPNFTTILTYVTAIKVITDKLPNVTTTVSDANDANSFTLTAGAAATDAYLGHIIVVIDAHAPTLPESRLITYWSDARVVEVDMPFTFTPAAGDAVTIWSVGYWGELWETIERTDTTTNVFDNRPGTSSGQGMTIYNQAGDDP